MSEYRRFGDALGALKKQVSNAGELAYIGYQDALGTYITTDPSNPMYVWVRIGGDPRYVRKANNAQGVPPDPNLPVRVGIPPGKHELHVLGLDEGAITYYGGRIPGVAPPHSHEFGALWDPVSIRRFKPGLVEAKQFGGAWTMNVYINPFVTYRADGTLLVWKGGWIDLTSSIPGTGQRRWALVGISLAGEIAMVTNGPPYGLAIPLTVDQIEAMDASDMLPLAGVNVYYGMTEVRESDITDMRPFPVVPFGGGTGTVIPGAGAWNVDLAPVTPHADDDEFTGVALDGDWTEETRTSAITVTVADDKLTLTTDDYFLTELAGVYRVAPADDYQIVVKVATRIGEDLVGGGDFCKAGIALALSGVDGYYIGFALAENAYEKYVELGAKTPNTGGAYSVALNGTAPVTGNPEWVYLRLRYDATNEVVVGDFSVDGLTWKSVSRDVSELAAAPATVWLYILAPDPAAADFEFFRVRSGFGASTDPVYGRNEDVLSEAGNVSYAPSDGADWPDPDPTTVQGALDALAAGWGGALADHDHSGDAGDGGTFDAANLTSGAATDGYVLTADGLGGAAWEAPSGGTPTVYQQALWSFEGTLSVGASPLRIYNATGVNKTLSKVFLAANTAPMGAALIVDIHKGGTTIFTTQANRPQIADGANTGQSTTIDVTAWNAGEYLTAEIDQIGSTDPGSDLVVHVVYS